jgi:hypothetical protein
MFIASNQNKRPRDIATTLPPTSPKKKLKGKGGVVISPSIDQLSTSHLPRNVGSSYQSMSNFIFERLSRQYEHNFSASPDNKQSTSFLQLRDQVLKIEYSIAYYKVKQAKNDLREAVKLILKNQRLSHAEKMAELGAFYFFLKRDLKIPHKPDHQTFTEIFAMEIVCQIKDLKTNYKATLGKKRDTIASGSTHHILWSFACMMLTREQKFNVGAAFALQALLTDARHRLALYLQPEHRRHIISVLNLILNKPHFQKLLEKEVSVHHSLKKIVRLDLKIPKDAAIRSADVMRACLIALFFDVRQINMPNCYSVSSLLFVIENYGYQALSQMLLWLSSGFLKINDLEIPIASLIEDQYVYPHNLNDSVTVREAFSLPVMEKIATILSCDKKPLSNETQPLRSTLTELIKQNNKRNNDLDYAEKLFDSFKYNSIASLMLTLFTFQELNKVYDEDLYRYSLKFKVIETIMSQCEKFFPQEFCIALRRVLKETLWLEAFSDRHATAQDNGKVIYGKPSEREEIEFLGDSKALKKLFHRGEIITYCNDGVFFRLKKISDLQSVLSTLTVALAPDFAVDVDQFESFIRSEDFVENIAQLCAQIIKEPGIQAKDLIAADLLLFREEGGNAKCIINDIFDLPLKLFEIKTRCNPELFLHKLSLYFKQLDPALRDKFPCLLMGSESHFFLLDTVRCKSLWVTPLDWSDFIDERIYFPAEEVMKSPMSDQERKCLLKGCAKKDKGLYQQLEKEVSNHKRRSDILDALLTCAKDESTRIKYSKAFDKALYTTALSIAQLDSLMKNLKIETDTPTLVDIFYKISKKFYKGAAEPFRLAHIISKTLIDLKLAVLDPYEIEQCLCRQLGLPIPFDVGDMNWADMDREGSPHARLVIRYNFSEKKMQFMARFRDFEDLEKVNDYKRVVIYLPEMKSN